MIFARPNERSAFVIICCCTGLIALATGRVELPSRAFSGLSGYLSTSIDGEIQGKCLKDTLRCVVARQQISILHL